MNLAKLFRYEIRLISLPECTNAYTFGCLYAAKERDACSFENDDLCSFENVDLCSLENDGI